MHSSPKYKLWLSMCLCLALAGCPALPILIPPLVQFGANLLDSAVNNYDETHQQNMQSLLTALQQRTNPYLTQGIIANPNNQVGGVPSTGHQNDAYQTVQDYPPSQGYPQQEYDPYQNSQPQNEEHAAYSHNQYENQFPQDTPYANQQEVPYQETPMPSNPAYSQHPYSQTNQQDYPSRPRQPQPPQQEHPYSETYGNEANPIDIAQGTNTPISLDVLLVKKHSRNGVQSYLPIKDGDALFDGRGNAQAGDKFRVMFRANTNCYVYVIAVDGSAWAQGIFPSTSNPFANPVKAAQQYLLPEDNNWFSLDQFKGIETIFVVASHERRPDIEEILTTISGRERHPAEKPMAVSEPAIIPHGFSGARPSAKSFAFNSSPQLQQQLLPTTYFVKTAGEDLRITRWFRHQ